MALAWSTRRPDRVTEVPAEQLGRYSPRDPLGVLIEAEPFSYLGAAMQNVEQPDPLATATISLVDRITRTVPVDEALRCIDDSAWGQRLSNPSGSPCRFGEA